MRKLLLFVITFILIGNSTAISQTTNPHWASIDWNNIGLNSNVGFEQTITILKKPTGIYNKTQVAWSLNVGNAVDRLSPYIEIFNHDLVVFGFRDVSSDVRFTQEQNTKCSTSSPNFMSVPGTFQAHCATPLEIKEGTSFKYRIYPTKSADLNSWKADIQDLSSKKLTDLGTIKFSVPQVIFINSQAMYGFNQIWNSGENAETFQNKDCPGLHYADVIFSKITSINSEQPINFTSFRQTPNCPNVIFGLGITDASIKYALNDNSKSDKNTDTSVPLSNPTPTVSPSISSSKTEILSNNSIELVGLKKLSFSKLNVSNNKLNIYVNGEKGEYDSVVLLSNELTTLGNGKIYGIYDGSQYLWDLPINNSLSGKLISIKVVGVKNGIESQPIQTEIQIPQLSMGKAQVEPSKLQSLKSTLNNSQLVLIGQISSDTKRYPTSGFLYSTSLGIPQNKPLQGEIVGNRIFFNKNISQKYLGKRVTVNIILQNDFGKSPLFVNSFVIPKQVDLYKNQILISCKKGNTIRTFQAKDCPPGWTV